MNSDFSWIQGFFWGMTKMSYNSMVLMLIQFDKYTKDYFMLKMSKVHGKLYFNKAGLFILKSD